MTLSTTAGPLYQRAIHWIAQNDEPLQLDIDVVSSQNCVALVADLFQIGRQTIAIDVVRIRRELHG